MGLWGWDFVVEVREVFWVSRDGFSYSGGFFGCGEGRISRSLGSGVLLLGRVE